MKFVKVPFSGGCLGKNLGCSLAPGVLLGDSIEINVKNDDIDYSGREISNFVKGKSDLFLVGGDHSITYFSFSSFSSEDCGLIIFDAHPDVQNSDFVTHEDYLRVLVDKGLVKPENIVIIGVRAASKEELGYLRDHKILYFDMDRIYDLGVKEVCDLIIEKMSGISNLYLSIDIDAVDPSFAPGTGYIEPGGLSSVEILHMLKRIRKMKNLKIVDLVEINPEKDINNLTTNLGKKILEVFR